MLLSIKALSSFELALSIVWCILASSKVLIEWALEFERLSMLMSKIVVYWLSASGIVPRCIDY